MDPVRISHRDAIDGFLVAAGFFTRLPFPYPSQAPRLADAIWAAPLAGVVVGLACGVAGGLAMVLGLPPHLAAVVALAAGMLVTGALHEEIFESDSAEVDLTNKRPDDSRRYEGLRNGDTVTILGAKGSGGALIPEALYAGDRVAFDQSNVNQASSLFQMGICMMGLAPLLLLAGLLFALFKR